MCSDDFVKGKYIHFKEKEFNATFICSDCGGGSEIGAIDGNKTIISSVHQPSSEVFSLFDGLCLLSGGEVVYFGDAKSTTKFFAEVGFPCLSRINPSDHFLRCINSDFDLVSATLKGSMKLRRV